MRSILRSTGFAILAGLLVSTELNLGNAAAPSPGRSQSEEDQYWREMRARRDREKRAAAQELQRKREEARSMIADLAQAGDAVQREIIVAEQGPPPPPRPPSLFERHPEYFYFGGAFTLIAMLTAATLIRHKREAEIRALSGLYLSDGTEIARFKMPALFEEQPTAIPFDTPPTAVEPEPVAEKAAEEPGDAGKEKFTEFFAKARQQIEEMRNMLVDVARAFDESERGAFFLKLHEQVSTLKAQADCWDLRPVWQLTSALELLLKRLSEKGKEATPSTLHTVAVAVDLLRELCVPGVRPDLIINPPISILAVDDDMLCLRAVMFALQKAEMTPDVAQNGELAVAKAAEKSYDVVFMDIMMPLMDGLTACKMIHELPKNKTTPVVFVTARSDYRTHTESNAAGGADLIAKPFLMFEITVKAVTYAMRKRLDLAEAARRDLAALNALSEAENSGLPSQPATNKPIVASAAANEAPTSTISSAAPSPSTPSAAASVQPSAGQADNQSPVLDAKQNQELAHDLAGDFYAKVPAYLAATRSIIREISVEHDPVKRRQRLEKVCSRLHALGAVESVALLKFTSRINNALESLVKRLWQNPKAVTPSTLSTVTNALIVLEDLLERGAEYRLANQPPIKMLVVEDEPLARRAVVGTLQLAFDKPDSANDGLEALKLASETAYDVIFSDIEMPDMGGFGLCSRLREGGLNQNTPIIFITSHTDLESRAQADQRGATDLIAKPFLPIEITVKALTSAVQKRLLLNGPVDSEQHKPLPSERTKEAHAAETAVPA